MNNRKRLSFNEIEQAAQQQLSSFDGGYSSYDGAAHPHDYYGNNGQFVEEYDGFGDDEVDFGDYGTGAITFANEMAADRQYQFTIVNASATAQDVILCPSYRPSNALRVIREGVIPYTGGATDLTATGSPETLDDWMLFIKDNPTRIVQFQIETNNSSALSAKLTTQHRSPWQILPINQINMINYRTEFASNDKLNTIRKQLQFDYQTELIYTVPARLDSSTPTRITFNLFIGGVHNRAKSLHKKFNRATKENPTVRQNLVMMGNKGLASANV